MILHMSIIVKDEILYHQGRFEIDKNIIYILFFRLQRVQEERSRRNTNRYYDENDQSSSLYIRHGDQTSFGQQFPGVNGSTPAHLTYFPTNPVL
jgi:hypothetical protein